MSNDYELIPKPATPPKEWKEIRPELSKNTSVVMYGTFAGLTLLFGSVCALIAVTTVGWPAATGVSLITLLLAIGIIGARTVNDYGLYATWIYNTVPPTNEKLEVTVKYVGEFSTFYKAKVISPDGQEEIYDIKTIAPNDNLGSSLCDHVKEVKAYRDPVNQQCVAVAVDQIIVWLWEYTPY